VAQLYHNVPTKMQPGPDDVPRVLRGAEGFNKEVVTIFTRGDPICADQQPAKQALQPACCPLTILWAFQQCQVGSNVSCS
jgi:hypothetical protein